MVHLCSFPLLYLLNDPTIELRSALYALCLPFGRVLSVVAMRSDRLRGSAHVCFRDLSSATTALRQLNGFIFYGRPLVSKRRWWTPYDSIMSLTLKPSSMFTYEYHLPHSGRKWSMPRGKVMRRPSSREHTDHLPLNRLPLIMRLSLSRFLLRRENGTRRMRRVSSENDVFLGERDGGEKG